MPRFVECHSINPVACGSLFILLITCDDLPVLVGVQGVEEIVTAVLLRRVGELEDGQEWKIKAVFTQWADPPTESIQSYFFLFFFTVTDSNNVDMVNYMAERRVMWRQGKQCISNSLKGGKKSSGACTGKAPNIPSDLSLSLSHSHLHFHLPVYSLWNDISLKNQMVSQLSATSPSFGDVSKWMNVCKVLVTVSVLDHGFPTRGKTT